MTDEKPPEDKPDRDIDAKAEATPFKEAMKESASLIAKQQMAALPSHTISYNENDPSERVLALMLATLPTRSVMSPADLAHEIVRRLKIQGYRIIPSHGL